MTVDSGPQRFKCDFQDTLPGTNIHAHETTALLTKGDSWIHAYSSFMDKEALQFTIGPVSGFTQETAIKPEEDRVPSDGITLICGTNLRRNPATNRRLLST